MLDRLYIIGPFGYKKDKTFRGGLYTACISLETYLSNGFEIKRLNTSLKNNKSISFWTKFLFSIKKNISFCTKIVFGKKGSVLIFLSGGASYIDKLLPILISKLKGNKIILLPSSGSVVNDVTKPVYRFFIMLSYQNADKIICQSDYWKTFFLSLSVRSQKLVVVENWILDEVFIQSKKLEFKSKIPKNKSFKLVFVSRIEKDKGIDELIHAIHLLKNKINIVLHVYGDGNFKEQMLNLINELDLNKNIQYKGWLNKKEMLRIVNTYDLGVFPSHFEGYPNTLLDFIFAKIPVVCSNIPSCMAVGKDNMIYFKVKSPISLAEKIEHAYHNYPSLITNSKKAIESKENNHIKFSGEKIFNLLKNFG